MPHSKKLISKEPELLPKIAELKKAVFAQEEKLFSLIDDFVSVNIQIKDFYRKVYLKRLGKYIIKAEKLKRKIMGEKEPSCEIEENESSRNDPIETSPEIKKEMKIIYRKLAKLYHPDRVKNESRDFLNKRMSEINEAFQKEDIKTLKRYLKRADAEIGLELSSLERISYLKTDLSVLNDMRALYEKKLEFLKENRMYKLLKKNPEEREKVFADIEDKMKFEIEIDEKIVKILQEDEKKQ